MNGKKKRPLALYVHIPFCAAKCSYCDFASWPNRADAWEPYCNALIGELESWKETLGDYEVVTLFFGGGTPSLWPAENIARIMRAVRETVALHPDAEITMEANPGTLTEEKLRICREAGVNRISLGAQAMDDGLLQMLGRIHSVAEIEDAVRMARAAGFDNLSLDLMYDLPGQTMALWQDTLDKAIALQPEHISAYSLIVEEGTPLCGWVEAGNVTVPDDDVAVEMQRCAVERLAEAGYERYEISNYARAGRECRHNCIYWERGEYLGLGCAAHSLMNGVRFENPRSLEDYLGGARRLEEVHLTRADAMEETVMLSTRMCRGMNLADYRKAFGVDFEARHAKEIARLQDMGLLTVEDGFLCLTRSGLELQNAVVVELMDP